MQTSDGDQLSPALVYDAATHTYLLAWQDTREPSGIYAQRWQLPQARFSAAPLSGSTQLTVTFTNQTVSHEGLVTYLWDFGDGTSGSTLTNPEHIYTERGAYDVTLTASAGSYAHTLRQANTIFVGLPHPTAIDYTYDGLYRLTAANYSTGERFQYAYDPVGNRTAQTATIASTVVTAYQYDDANRLTHVNDQEYTWDDNGNLVSDGAKAYTYNQANRLTAIEDESSTVTYAYNGDGVRLQQENSSAAIQYTQDLAAPLPVVLQSQVDEVTTRYVYALGTRPLAQYSSDVPEYLLADALGSVRQIIDADGNVTLAESYEPYGSVLSSIGAASSIFGYSGEQVDTYIKLVFLRARYMQPTLGIFLARDPWEGDVLRPGSMNGWSYAEGEPVNHTDPTGQWALEFSNQKVYAVAEQGDDWYSFFEGFGYKVFWVNFGRWYRPSPRVGARLNITPLLDPLIAETASLGIDQTYRPNALPEINCYPTALTCAAGECRSLFNGSYSVDEVLRHNAINITEDTLRYGDIFRLGGGNGSKLFKDAPIHYGLILWRSWKTGKIWTFNGWPSWDRWASGPGYSIKLLTEIVNHYAPGINGDPNPIKIQGIPIEGDMHNPAKDPTGFYRLKNGIDVQQIIQAMADEKTEWDRKPPSGP